MVTLSCEVLLESVELVVVLPSCFPLSLQLRGLGSSLSVCTASTRCRLLAKQVKSISSLTKLLLGLLRVLSEADRQT